MLEDIPDASWLKIHRFIAAGQQGPSECHWQVPEVHKAGDKRSTRTLPHDGRSDTLSGMRGSSDIVVVPPSPLTIRREPSMISY